MRAQHVLSYHLIKVPGGAGTCTIFYYRGGGLHSNRAPGGRGQWPYGLPILSFSYENYLFGLGYMKRIPIAPILKLN